MSQPAVFVCYQRADSRDLAARLRDALASRLDQVFFDVESIPGGATYREVIHEHLARADVVLVLIGERWDAARLHDEADDVREELVLARTHGKRVIPVLLGRTAPPPAEQVPAELRWLLDVNAVHIRAENGFLEDAGRLADTLTGGRRGQGGDRAERNDKRSKLPVLIGLAIAAVAATVLALTLSGGGGDGAAPATSAAGAGAAEVPPVVRLDSDRADATIRVAGLRPVFQAVLDDSLLYTVIDQSPTAGAQAAAGSAVSLKVELNATTAAFAASRVVVQPSCDTGQFTIGEQRWNGVNVKSAAITIKKSGGNTDGGLSVSRGTTRGAFAGTVGKQTVACSTTGTTTVTYTITVKGPSPVQGGSAPTATADARFTIGPRANVIKS